MKSVYLFFSEAWFSFLKVSGQIETCTDVGGELVKAGFQAAPHHRSHFPPYPRFCLRNQEFSAKNGIFSKTFGT